MDNEVKIDPLCLYDIQLTILTAKLYIGITEKKKKR